MQLAHRRRTRTSHRLTAAGLGLALLVAACADGGGSEAEPDQPPVVEETELDEDAPDAEEVEAETASEEQAAPPVDPAEVGANELGQIPVLMYHQLLDSGGSEYDLTPAEFRAELEWLYEHDYRPVRMADVARGHIDIPAGTSPVVLTFDDSTRSQFALTEDGEVDPDTKIGMLLAFGEEHEDWDATAASFYVITSALFGGGADSEDLLAQVADLGFEIGNHTHGHPNLRNLDAAGVQRELATNAAYVARITGQEVSTLALPLGVRPTDVELAGAGEHDGTRYEHLAVLLVGAHPAPSPFSADWDPLGVPRIRSSPSWDGGEPDYGSAFWLESLENNPERRFVSDGDPETISFPADREEDLAPAFADRANPY